MTHPLLALLTDPTVVRVGIISMTAANILLSLTLILLMRQARDKNFLDHMLLLRECVFVLLYGRFLLGSFDGPQSEGFTSFTRLLIALVCALVLLGIVRERHYLASRP